jgi:hypothetical protein
MRARLGPKQAMVATAHKIARTVYQRLKTGEPDREESAAIVALFDNTRFVDQEGTIVTRART